MKTTKRFLRSKRYLRLWAHYEAMRATGCLVSWGERREVVEQVATAATDSFLAMAELDALKSYWPGRAERMLDKLEAYEHWPWIGQYILDEQGNPVQATSLRQWGEWMEKREERIVKQEHIGGYFVSTVFLGLDQRYWGEGPPILWETMVFSESNTKIDRPYDRSQYRYASREDAIAGHRKIVQMLTS